MKDKANKASKTSANCTSGTQPLETASPDVNQDELVSQIAQDLESAAQSAQNEELSLQLQIAAQKLRERSKWKLEKEWPGFFKLFKNETGHFTATLDERLEAIESRIRHGLEDSSSQVATIAEALKAILFCAHKPQPFVVPQISHIPPPAIAHGLRTNIAEIHKAAVELWQITAAPCLVFEVLQRTLGRSLRVVFDTPLTHRPDAIKDFKRNLMKAVDSLCSEWPDDVTHRNKAMVRASGGKLLPFSMLAIQEARLWVEAFQELPTKHQLETALREKYPKQVPNKRTWPKILKEAGLDGLPHKVPYQH